MLFARSIHVLRVFGMSVTLIATLYDFLTRLTERWLAVRVIHVPAVVGVYSLRGIVATSLGGAYGEQQR